MEAFGVFPEGNGTIRLYTGSFVNEPLETEIEPKSDESFVEEIDLGDSVLFLIQGHIDNTVEPIVKVDVQKITVTLGLDKPNITLEPGFPVDLEKSNASYRNGVVEIHAVKAEKHHESDGYLKIE